MKAIRLRAGKERSLQRRHPWVFEGSIAKGRADAGETVRIEAHDGAFLAWGAYSPASAIRARAWSFDEAERIDAAFFERRVRQALQFRERLGIDSDARRLVHGEADGLPGLVVDRYGDTLVAQFGFAGVERWKAAIADALLGAAGLPRLYERSDIGVRRLEGLPEQRGWLRGDGPTQLEIREHGWTLQVDIAHGHKTGAYLDQRTGRQRFAHWVQRLGCAEVLNAFSYTGGFTLAALAAGARQVTSVDSSAPALELARAHVARNGFDPHRHEAVDADANGFLRQCLDQGRRFDAIVLDPPKFAATAAQAERAARAYKDINRLALRALRPGGLLFTFSCSGGIGAELFQKIVAGAAVDAGVDGAIVERLGAAPDHPATLFFPEGEYLKGLALLV
ncbi:MAG: class I SAM-dependent methyltransferase [Burkholderiales bacterium]|nr:class I SAM-dependent methyltransferase [Burkholderiales bacterium]